MGKSRRLVGLDVLRGVAILLVLLNHGLPAQFPSAGIVGVTIFFALSGYLITGILTKDLDRHGKVRYGRFYRNRAIRLIPALLFMVAGLVVVTLIWDPLGEVGSLRRAVIVALTYTGNLPFFHGSGAIAHLWTLATEEQFYVVWPIVLAIGFHFRKYWLAVTVAALAILAVLIASILHAGDNVSSIYAYPTSWSLAMVIGAAARLGETRIDQWFPRDLGARALGSVALVGLIAISVTANITDRAAAYLIEAPLIAALSVVLIFVAKKWEKLPTNALRPILALGTISYAAYLWNYPMTIWVSHAGLTGWTNVIGAVVATIAAATISWYAIERPMMQFRKRLDSTKPSANLADAELVSAAS